MCYDTFGHGYFLEDGGEKDTVFDRNLGLGQRGWRGTFKFPVTGVLPTDGLVIGRNIIHLLLRPRAT